MTVINVIYQSKRGKTRKIAEAIASACNVEAIDIESRHRNVSASDLLFVGMGTYGGKPDSAILDYLDQLPANTIKGAALFSTSATGKDHMELAVNLLEHKGIQLYPRRLLLKGSFLFLNGGRPNQKDCEMAAAFAEEVVGAFIY